MMTSQQLKGKKQIYCMKINHFV